MMARIAVRRTALTVLGATIVSLGLACGARHDAATGRSHRLGTVTGRLIREGGPLGPGGQQPAVRPLRGLVQFTSAGHRVVNVRVGRSGTFSVSLAPGTYRVTGRSPEITQAGGASMDGGPALPCARPVSVTVTPQHTAKITLACIVP